MVNNGLYGVVRRHEAGHPEGLQWTTAVDVNFNVLPLSLGIVVNVRRTGNGMPRDVADGTEVSTVTTVANERQVILLANSAVFTWIRMTPAPRENLITTSLTA